MSLESMGIYNPDYAAGLGESILAVKDTAEQRRGANQEESSKPGSAEDVLPYGEGLNEQMLKRQEIDVARKNFRDIMDRNDKANIDFETTGELEKTKQGIGKLDATQEEIRREISQEVSEVDDNKGAGERIRGKSYQRLSSQENSSVLEEQGGHNEQHEKTNLSALYERLLSSLRTLQENSKGWRETYGDLTLEDVAGRLIERLRAFDTSSLEMVENSVGTSATKNADTEPENSNENGTQNSSPSTPASAVPVSSAVVQSPSSVEPVEPNSSNVSSPVKSGISSMYNIDNKRQEIAGIYGAIGNEPAEPSGIYKSVMEGDQARRQEKIREQISNIQEKFIRGYGLSVEGEESKRYLEIFSQNLYSLQEMIKEYPNDYNNKDGFTGNMLGVLGVYGILKESGISLPSEEDFMKAQFGEDLGGELLRKFNAMYENTNLESSDNESDKVPYDLESRLSIFENSDVQLEGDSEDARENVAHLVGMTQDEITDNPESFVKNLIELRAQITASDLLNKRLVLRAISNAHTSFKILLPESFNKDVQERIIAIKNSGEQVHVDNSKLEQPSTPVENLTSLRQKIEQSAPVESSEGNSSVKEVWFEEQEIEGEVEPRLMPSAEFRSNIAIGLALKGAVNSDGSFKRIVEGVEVHGFLNAIQNAAFAVAQKLRNGKTITKGDRTVFDNAYNALADSGISLPPSASADMLWTHLFGQVSVESSDKEDSRIKFAETTEVEPEHRFIKVEGSEDNVLRGPDLESVTSIDELPMAIFSFKDEQKVSVGRAGGTKTDLPGINVELPRYYSGEVFTLARTEEGLTLEEPSDSTANRTNITVLHKMDNKTEKYGEMSFGGGEYSKNPKLVFDSSGDFIIKMTMGNGSHEQIFSMNYDANAGVVKMRKI